jgi:hypothetical protein
MKNMEDLEASRLILQLLNSFWRKILFHSQLIKNGKDGETKFFGQLK